MKVNHCQSIRSKIKKITILFLFFGITLITVVSLFQCAGKPVKNIKIGPYYADVIHGLTFIKENESVFIFRIGWFDKEGNYKYKYRTVENSAIRFDLASPDGTYGKVGWNINGSLVWFEWARIGNQGAVGKIYTDGTIEIVIESFPTWDKYQSAYKIQSDGYAGNSVSTNTNWRFKSSVANKQAVCFNQVDREKFTERSLSQSKSDSTGQNIFTLYELGKNKPLHFVASYSGFEYDFNRIDDLLKLQREEYQKNRCIAQGDWGNFLEPVINHLNHSKVYGAKTGLLAHITSRDWCSKDDQTLYEWDTFFHSMLASLEDPEGAKNTIRAILLGQQENGIVPNVVRNFGHITTDRAQPPVGAICVWKIHQYINDMEFLNEVYPKLLRFHDWWFAKRPSNGLPYRDGNNNGLLEWGSETITLQKAKYESGLDNSPMFDFAILNENSGTMELDMAGLSGLWAADALFLSYIAKELGSTKDAERLEQESIDMGKRLNKLLWNEKLGMYCNRFWTEYSKMPTLDYCSSITANYFRTQNGTKGITARYIIEDDTTVSIEEGIRISQKQIAKLKKNENYKIIWEGTITPEKSGRYFFGSSEEIGVRLWINDRKIIDNLYYWVTEFISSPVKLEANKPVKIKLEYSGKNPFELMWTPEVKSEDTDLFSDVLTPTNFYPMISGAPDSTQATKILNVLTDTTLFWGEYVCPTVTKTHFSFPTQGYWRGRIWPPTNYLMYLGIKKYADPDLRYQFADKNVRIVMNSWKQDGEMYENYYANGKGAGDPHYCWGGLFPLIGLEEIIDFNQDGELIQNTKLNGNYALYNFPIHGNLHNIQVNDGVYSIRKANDN